MTWCTANCKEKRIFLNMVFKVKSYRFPFIHLFAILMTVMFLITIILSLKLLTNDHCNCPKQESVLDTSKVKIPTRFFESSHKLAVLVPYRERFEELVTFAPYMHNFLNSQRINHDIFILNQVDKYRFNRASLINVGYLLTKDNYDYIAMHDVDLLPLNKNLTYYYPKQPFHLAAPKLHPRYHYEKFIGGILLVNREHFQLVNGLSNNYWGWGLEDDEFYVRLKDAGLTVNRPEGITTGMNDTFRHLHPKERKRDITKCYNQYEVTRKRDRQTGLHNVKYNILSRKSIMIDEAPLTLISVQLICDHNLTPWCNCNGKKTEKKISS